MAAAPEPAPFDAATARAPSDTRALWLRAGDGVRLRAALAPVPRGAAGTVILLPGRTEYVEKYGDAMGELAARGFASLTLDWRGQGLAERLLPDPLVGHVRRFGDYQRDLDAALALAAAEALPRPYFLLGHSMGGCIGLRALHRTDAFAAAAFSAPMWGLRLTRGQRPLAVAAGMLGRVLVTGGGRVPGRESGAYVASAPFEGNLLTRDAQMFATMVEQLRAQPALALGAPSLRWLGEAMAECAALMGRAPPRVPALVQLGGNERIVEPRAIHARMRDWPAGRLEVVPGAEHELMMETPQVRAGFFDAACALFRAYR